MSAAYVSPLLFWRPNSLYCGSVVSRVVVSSSAAVSILRRAGSAEPSVRPLRSGVARAGQSGSTLIPLSSGIAAQIDLLMKDTMALAGTEGEASSVAQTHFSADRQRNCVRRPRFPRPVAPSAYLQESGVVPLVIETPAKWHPYPLRTKKALPEEWGDSLRTQGTQKPVINIEPAAGGRERFRFLAPRLPSNTASPEGVSEAMRIEPGSSPDHVNRNARNVWGAGDGTSPELRPGSARPSGPCAGIPQSIRTMHSRDITKKTAFGKGFVTLVSLPFLQLTSVEAMVPNEQTPSSRSR
jgi:hypothetical protein